MSLEQAVVQLEQTNAALQEEVVRFRDAAMGLNNIYPNVTEGRQGTADGKYFSVPGSGTFMRLYRRQGTTAELIAEYPDRQSLVQAVSDAEAAQTAAEAARDEAQNIAAETTNTILGYADRATLDLNFRRGRYRMDDGELTETTNAFDLLSVTRATPKWVEGPNGKLREVPPNTIAREWRNGVPQGALIEESRTNLLLWSQDLAQSSLANPGMSTELADEYFGDIQAYKFTRVGDSGFDANSLPISVVAGRAYTYTVVCKPGNVSDIGLTFKGFTSGGWQRGQFSLVTGLVSGPTAGPIRVLEPKHYPDGWVAISISVDCDQTISNAQVDVRLPTRDDPNGDYVYIGTRQVEEGTVGSSYIPTTDAPVTRAADNVSRTLGGEFNARGFTIIGRVVPPKVPGSVCELAYEGARGSRIGMIFQTPSDFRTEIRLSAGGANRGDSSSTIDPEQEMIFAWSLGERDIVVVNGVTARDDINQTTLDLNELAMFALGGRANLSSGFLNSEISDFRIYPRALSKQELIEITS